MHCLPLRFAIPVFLHIHLVATLHEKFAFCS